MNVVRSINFDELPPEAPAFFSRGGGSDILQGGGPRALVKFRIYFMTRANPSHRGKGSGSLMNIYTLCGGVASKPFASIRTVCFILEAPCLGKC